MQPQDRTFAEEMTRRNIEETERRNRSKSV
jgi:hypothetical protein